MSEPEKMRIPIVTGITAGRGIPDDYTDWQITGFRDIRAVDTFGRPATIAAVPVEGDSLRDQGIFDGDVLIMRVTRDYEDGRLGVWQTPQGRTAKQAFFNSDGFVVLHNHSDWSQTWSPDDIRLLGLVIRVERDFE